MSEDLTNVELPVDDEVIEEGMHDPKNAEAQSVASVDKAEDGVAKQAKARTGDKLSAKDEPSGAPKTKAGMINAMFSRMSGMSKAEMSKMYSSYHESVEADLEVEEVVEFNHVEELDAVIAEEATLSDEFKTKTAVIFEAALNSKIADEVDRLENEYQTNLEEGVQSARDELVEKVDNYLNYVVEQWMSENQIAVEQGLRTEIAEGFMNQLKDLFVESYIEVPETKVNLVDELAEQVEELESKLNTSTGSIIEMTEKLELLQRDAIVREHSRDLAESQVEKLRGLVDSIDFEDEESFINKVKTVKESYFATEASAEVSEIAEDLDAEEVVESNSTMSQYLNAIQRTNKNK